MTKKPKTGTREWSEHSVNCFLGCSNGCLYCYARSIATRFGWMDRLGDWTKQIAHVEPLARVAKRYPGRVMFPTQHDITPGNWSTCLDVLHRLLQLDNDVLLVTKPHPDLMEKIVAVWREETKVGEHGPSLEVRCTITCLDDSVRRFWEPFAPTIDERLEALAYASMIHGLQTSVSMEPLLEAGRVAELVAKVEPLVTQTIWVGKANHLRARTAWLRRKRPEIVEQLGAEIAKVEAGQTDAKVREIFGVLRYNPKIRWKDSYRKTLVELGVLEDTTDAEPQA